MIVIIENSSTDTTTNDNIHTNNTTIDSINEHIK